MITIDRSFESNRPTIHSMTRQVWFVTGTSSGFGLSTVQELLKTGYKVAATTRSLAKLQAALGGEFHVNCLPLEVDLTNESSIKQAVEQTISHFGQLDVVVNNAGYLQAGIIEDVSRDQVVRQFEINFLAVHAVVQAVLPHFRSRSNGYIINVASAVTVNNVPVMGIYTASKCALVGYSDVLGVEVAPFGIKVTTVLPGPFDTGFGGATQPPVAEGPAYEKIYAARAASRATRKLPGSTELSAKLFIELANNPTPPTKIFLGKMANDWAKARAQANLQEVEEWSATGSKVDVV
jgi:NAD(P)-dependent dehydrogenase (short-subunit alcohol dehydrogenase family)